MQTVFLWGILSICPSVRPLSFEVSYKHWVIDNFLLGDNLHKMSLTIFFRENVASLYFAEFAQRVI